MFNFKKKNKYQPTYQKNSTNSSAYYYAHYNNPKAMMIAEKMFGLSDDYWKKYDDWKNKKRPTVSDGDTKPIMVGMLKYIKELMAIRSDVINKYAVKLSKLSSDDQTTAICEQFFDEIGKLVKENQKKYAVEVRKVQNYHGEIKDQVNIDLKMLNELYFINFDNINDTIHMMDNIL